MSVIWHFIVNVVISFVFTGVAFLAVNVALIISGRGSPRGIGAVLDIRKTLRRMPARTVVECRDRSISVVEYDRAHDRDSTRLLYTATLLSPLAWSTGPRSVGSLRGRANATLAITVGALVLVYLPLLAVGAALAINVSGLWWFAVIGLIGAEVVMMLTRKFFILKWSTFSGLVPVIFLHRYHLYPLSVMYVIAFCWLLVSMTIIVWMDRSSTFKD